MKMRRLLFCCRRASFVSLRKREGEPAVCLQLARHPLGENKRRVATLGARHHPCIVSSRTEKNKRNKGVLLRKANMMERREPAVEKANEKLCSQHGTGGFQGSYQLTCHLLSYHQCFHLLPFNPFRCNVHLVAMVTLKLSTVLE